MDKSVHREMSPTAGDRNSLENGTVHQETCVCGRPLDMVTIFINPSTGGSIRMNLAASDSVESLRRVIAKQLRVPKERICLLYKERQLRDGSLDNNLIADGAKIMLVPAVEAGLLCQRPEQSVMQALESLNDQQVNDFLSGKAPLNLTMRLGDHMMLIQLQLSTVSPNGGSSGSGSKKSSRSSSQSGLMASSQSSNHSSHSHEHHHHHHYHHHYHHHHHAPQSVSSGLSQPGTSSNVSASASLFSSKSPVVSSSSSSSLGSLQSTSSTSSLTSHSNPSITSTTPFPQCHHVTSMPSSTGVKSNHRFTYSHSPQHTPLPPQTSQKSHHHYHHYYNHSQTPTTSSSSQQPHPAELEPPSSVQAPLRDCPHQSTQCNKVREAAATLNTKALADASRNLTQTLKQLSSEVLLRPEKDPSGSSSFRKPSSSSSMQTTHETISKGEHHYKSKTSAPPPALPPSIDEYMSSSSSCTPEAYLPSPPPSPTAAAAAVAAAAAASNSSSSTSGDSESGSRKRQGAIIESMHHHGKGVYSGTFSGTLNPALQDRQGRPKRDISTIIHILNDLLCATPHYASSRQKSSQKSSQSSTASTTSSSSDAASQNSLPSSQNVSMSTSPTSSRGEGVPSKTDERMEEERRATAEEDDMTQDVTRNKLEQLRFIMEQRRERRKARREARATPYGGGNSSSTRLDAGISNGTSSTWSSETTTVVTKDVVEGEPPQEEDPKTLLEINSATIVA